jgi:Xaa-Pro dipeptidase
MPPARGRAFDEALDAALLLPSNARGDEAEILARHAEARCSAAAAIIRHGFIIGSGADALLVPHQDRPPQARRLGTSSRWNGRASSGTTTAHDAHPVVGRADPAPRRAVRGLRAPRARRRGGHGAGKTFGDVFDAHARTLEAHADPALG